MRRRRCRFRPVLRGGSRVQGRAAAGTGRRDRLLVGGVGDVTAGEDPGDAGALRRRFNLDVAGLVELEDVGDELAARNLSNGDEQTRCLEPAAVPGDGVLQGDAGQRVLAVKLDDS